jgi:ribosomal protein S18 acetylase RimI-like enzyme
MIGLEARRAHARRGFPPRKKAGFAAMRASAAHGQTPPIRVRAGRPSDIDVLVALEQRTIATDRLSRRGFDRLLASPHAELKVAACKGTPVGYAIVRFAPRAPSARLYSIAVAPDMGGKGVAPLLIGAAEQAAIRRGRTVLRLEVREDNARAISRYEKSGFRRFGRYTGYYEDFGDALRLEKILAVAEPPAMNAGHGGGGPSRNRARSKRSTSCNNATNARAP